MRMLHRDCHSQIFRSASATVTMQLFEDEKYFSQCAARAFPLMSRAAHGNSFLLFSCYACYIIFHSFSFTIQPSGLFLPNIFGPANTGEKSSRTRALRLAQALASGQTTAHYTTYLGTSYSKASVPELRPRR